MSLAKSALASGASSHSANMTHGPPGRVKNVAEQWSPAFVSQPATYAPEWPISAIVSWDGRFAGWFQRAMHAAGLGGPALQADTASRVAVATITGSSCGRPLRLTRYETTHVVDRFSDGGANRFD
jgi:hypothetical protein